MRGKSDETAIAFVLLLFLLEFEPILQDFANGFSEYMVQVVLTQGTANEKLVSCGFDFALHLYRQLFTTG